MERHRHRPRLRGRLATLLPGLLASWLAAAAPGDIGAVYPAGVPSAEDIIAQVWYVNHFRAVRNYAVRKQGDAITYLVYRSADGKYRLRTLERYLNNDFPPDSDILAKDLAVFHYPPAVSGTGLLIVDYRDPDRSQSLTVWLPALRKPRRFNQPNHEDAYAGTDWTFGDVSLRKPQHETHELLRTEPFAQAAGGGGRLHVIEVPPTERKSFMRALPTGSDEFRDRRCYVVKSTTKFKDYWYDYRISWIDAETFADYRTLYYRGDTLVKLVDRDWQPMRGHGPSPDMTDPRAQFWVMWYGKTYATGHETMAVIPPDVSQWNVDIPDETWSLKFLERGHR
jgi:hypothetical protein